MCVSTLMFSHVLCVCVCVCVCACVVYDRTLLCVIGTKQGSLVGGERNSFSQLCSVLEAEPQIFYNLLLLPKFLPPPPPLPIINVVGHN